MEVVMTVIDITVRRYHEKVDPVYYKTGIDQMEGSNMTAIKVFIPYEEKLENALIDEIRTDFSQLLKRLKEEERNYDEHKI